jgi:hypothetical protein
MGFLSKKPKAAHPLDRRLLRWPNGQDFSFRHLMNGGIFVAGRPGSGKTSAVLAQILHAIANHRDTGGLILASSPGDLPLCQAIFESCGRLGDLVVFSESSPYRFNFINFVQTHLKGSTRDITQALTVLGETLHKGEASNTGDSQFWNGQMTRQIYNSVELLRQAYGTVTAPDIQLFITTSPKRVEHLSDEGFQSRFHHQTILKAKARGGTRIEQHDRSLALQYWQAEAPSMADKLRTSIDVCSFGLLHELNTGQVRELISTSTTLNPAAIDHGKWILVDMPITRCGIEGGMIQAGWQYLTQKWILARDSGRWNPPACIIMDEYQNRVNSFDAPFLNESRKFNGCTIALTQSINGLFANMKGENGKAFVDTLLTGFQTKIFCALGDLQTSEWASKLAGETRKFMMNGSLTPERIDPVDRLLGRTSATMGFSENMQPRLRPDEFMYGLRTGGTMNDGIVDSYVIRSGESAGAIRVSWKQ